MNEYDQLLRTLGAKTQGEAMTIIAKLHALQLRYNSAPHGSFRITKTGPRVCALCGDLEALDGKAVRLLPIMPPNTELSGG